MEQTTDEIVNKLMKIFYGNYNGIPNCDNISSIKKEEVREYFTKTIQSHTSWYQLGLKVALTEVQDFIDQKKRNLS